MTREQWLLMALAHRAGQPMSPVQIQKAMFLMRMEAGRHLPPGFYDFVPYNYGPFDVNIYHDLDSLIARGLVTYDGSSNRNWKVYAATPAGVSAGRTAMTEAQVEGLDYLKRAVDWVCSQSFTQLVRAIYAKYPAFKANSVFTG
jgi:hypothetical protein